MNSKNFYFERNTDYYIWWLLNCSSHENVEDKQIKKEVNSLINKIEYYCKKNGDSSMDLDILTEIRLFGYDIQSYKEYRENYARDQAQWKQEYQEEYLEIVRESVREEYREEVREVYRQEVREASRKAFNALYQNRKLG